MSGAATGDSPRHHPPHQRVASLPLPEIDAPTLDTSLEARPSYARARSSAALAAPQSPRVRSKSFSATGSQRPPLALVNTNYGTGSLVFKTVFVGDSFCGKTQLVNRVVHHGFDPTLLSTPKRADIIDMLVQVGEYIVTLRIHDTAGQERYRQALSASYFRNSMLCFVVYAINQRSSFLSARWWIERCLELEPPATGLILEDAMGHKTRILNMTLVGTHSDLTHCRQVSREEAEALAKEYDIDFIEVSSVSSSGAGELENQLCQLAENALLSVRSWRRSSDPGVVLNIRESFRNIVFQSKQETGEELEESVRRGDELGVHRQHRDWTGGEKETTNNRRDKVKDKSKKRPSETIKLRVVSGSHRSLSDGESFNDGCCA
jgi:GTPase SAR1 family protein